MIKKIIKAVIFTAFVSLALIVTKDVSARDADGDIVVIVDPGHGGSEPGATNSGLIEKDINWNIAVALKAELQTYDGVKVYLTRGSSEWFSNTGRGRFGNLLGADLVVSCHINSNASESPNGCDVYATVNAGFRTEITKLGNLVLDELSALGLNRRNVNFRGSSSDASIDYYTLIDEAVKMGVPAMIIEHCFISSPVDRAFLSNVTNQYNCGTADATAIARYYGLSKRKVSAGDNITLTRTYSATFDNVSGTFSSSDSKVAYVSDKGVITAVSQGSAVISCTKTDGSTVTVNVTVPAVKQVGVAGGIALTFYDGDAAARAYDKNMTVVKAIYSDGSAVQVNNVVFGGITYSDESTGAMNIPITWGGFTNNLRVYNYSVYVIKPSTDLAPKGTNQDVCLIPEKYIFPDGSTLIEPVEPPTEAPTEAPTEIVTEPATEAPSETQTESEAVTTASVEDDTHKGTLHEDSDSFPTGKVIAISVVGILLAGGVAAFVVIYNKKRVK